MFVFLICAQPNNIDLKHVLLQNMKTPIGGKDQDVRFVFRVWNPPKFAAKFGKPGTTVLEI